jgi:hypothetical protein
MIETYNLPAKFIKLKNYCVFAKSEDYMEFIEWHNGEGFDLNINGDRICSFTWGQYEALRVLEAYKEDR